MKTCKKCVKGKEITEFRKNKQYKDGLDNVCKECRKLEYKENPAQKNYYYRNHDKLLVREAEKRKNKEHREYHIQYNRKHRAENYESEIKRNREKREKNKEYHNEYQKKRSKLRKMLDSLNQSYDESQVYEYFNNECSLSGSTDDITLDHFIPIAWGHGGTYLGNVYPLKNNINMAKKDFNPFERIDFLIEQYHLDIHNWNKLIETLANQNNFTVDEFKDFVYWCEDNKRSLEDIQSNPTPSLDLWKARTIVNN